MYKATLKCPVSGTQTRVWWAGLVSPQPNNDSSLVYVRVRWLQYEDRSTRLFRKTLSKLWHLLDQQSTIDLRLSPMTSIWWLLYSLRTSFDVTGLPTVNAPPSTSLCKQLCFGNYAWSSLPLILSSFLQTTLRVLAPIVLQHYRLWYPELIPLTVTRSPLYVQTVGGLFIGQQQQRLWCCSPFFRPSVSLGVAHQLHNFSHPPHLEWLYREVHLNFTSWQSSSLVYVRVWWLQYEDWSTRMPTCSSLVFRHTSEKFRNDP